MERDYLSGKENNPTKYGEYLSKLTLRLQRSGFNVLSDRHSLLNAIMSQINEYYVEEVRKRIETYGIDLAALHKGFWPIDLTVCTSALAPQSMTIDYLRNYRENMFLITEEYAKAMIDGIGRSRLFYAILASTSFSDEVIEYVRDFDPVKDRREFSPSRASTYANIIIPVLVDLDSSQVFYFQNKHFIGRMYYSAFRKDVNDYFLF